MQNIERQLSFVLHRTAYQETSLLLDVFTQDYGRIGVIAKGAKRGKSKKSAILQPFIPLSIFCMGKGELLTLTEVDVESRHLILIGRRLVLGFYINELIIRVLQRHDPHPELFNIYYSTLLALEQSTEVDEQKILRLFEKSLLKAIGYELQLAQEIPSGMDVQPDRFYTFDPESGPKQVEGQFSYGLHTGKYAAYSNNNTPIYKGTSLLALAAGVLNDSRELLDAKRLMRGALARHLGSRPLASRQLF